MTPSIGRPLICGLAVFAAGCASVAEPEADAEPATDPAVADLVAAVQLDESDLTSPCDVNIADDPAGRLVAWNLAVDYDLSAGPTAIVTVEAPSVEHPHVRTFEIHESRADSNSDVAVDAPADARLIRVAVEDRTRTDIGEPYVEIDGFVCERVEIDDAVSGFVFRRNDGEYLSTDDALENGRRLVIPRMRSYVWPSAIVSTGPSLRARGIPSLPLGGAIVVTEPIPNDLFIDPADVEAPATDSQVLATTRWFVNRFASLDDSTMAIDARLRYSLAGRDIEVPLVYVPPRPLAVLDASETLVPAIVEAFEETLDDVAGDEVRLVLGVEIHVDELPLVEFEQIVFDQSQ